MRERKQEFGDHIDSVFKSNFWAQLHNPGQATKSLKT